MTAQGAVWGITALSYLHFDAPDVAANLIRQLYGGRFGVAVYGADEPSYALPFAVCEGEDCIIVLLTGLDAVATFADLAGDYTIGTSYKIAGHFFPWTLAKQAERVGQIVAGNFPPRGRSIGVVGFSFGGGSAPAAAVYFKAGLAGPVGDVHCLSCGAPKSDSVDSPAWPDNIPIARMMGNGDPIPLLVPTLSQIRGVPSRLILSFVVTWNQWIHPPGGLLLADRGFVFPSQEQAIPDGVGVLTVAQWAAQTKAGYTTEHSVSRYAVRLTALRNNYGPNADVRDPRLTDPVIPPLPPMPAPPLPADAGTTNKVGAGDPLMAWKCAIFWGEGEQGWQTIFYLDSATKDQAKQKCIDVIGFMVYGMHKDAKSIAFRVSDPDKVNGASDFNYVLPGQLNPSSIGSAQANLAMRYITQAGSSRVRIWWVHGLTSEMLLGGGGAIWLPTGASASGLGTTQNGLFNNAGTGTLQQAPAVCLRVTQRGAGQALGNVLNIAPDTDGRTLISTDTAKPINAPGIGTTLLLRGRQPTFGLPRTLRIFSRPDTFTYKMVSLLPPGFVYNDGFTLWISATGYAPITRFDADAIATHRTGAPFGRLRGRRAKVR